MKTHADQVVTSRLLGMLAATLIAKGLVTTEEVEYLVRGGVEGIEALAEDEEGRMSVFKFVYREVAETRLGTILAAAEKLK